MRTLVPVKRLVALIVFDDYLDLYLLATSALVIAILGVVGVADIKVLASAILGLLAVLAFSQIRSRHNVSQITKAQKPDPLAIFRRTFPDDLDRRRASASSLLLIGLSMSRTVRGISQDGLRAILNSGGSVRVLLLDPSNDELVRAASRHRTYGTSPEGLKKRIQGSLDDLRDLAENSRGDLEIRVTSFIPHMSMNVIDAGRRNGLIAVQHYEYRPAAEPSPIFCITPSDAMWFEHFAAEAERIWADGDVWPSVS
jgi:Domain of unknown function (DUF5919)